MAGGGGSLFRVNGNASKQPPGSKAAINAGTGVAIGTGVGTAIGVALGEIALGLAFGAGLGAAIGGIMGKPDPANPPGGDDGPGGDVG